MNTHQWNRGGPVTVLSISIVSFASVLIGVLRFTPGSILMKALSRFRLPSEEVLAGRLVRSVLLISVERTSDGAVPYRLRRMYPLSRGYIAPGRYLAPGFSTHLYLEMQFETLTPMATATVDTVHF